MSILNYLGWTGNVFIIIGLWLVGNKARKAFIFSLIGEAIWVVYSLNKNLYDLAFICAIFAALALRNWFAWGKSNQA